MPSPNPYSVGLLIHIVNPHTTQANNPTISNFVMQSSDINMSVTSTSHVDNPNGKNPNQPLGRITQENNEQVLEICRNGASRTLALTIVVTGPVPGNTGGYWNACGAVFKRTVAENNSMLPTRFSDLQVLRSNSGPSPYTYLQVTEVVDDNRSFEFYVLVQAPDGSFGLIDPKITNPP